MSPLLVILQKLSIAPVIKSEFLDLASKTRRDLPLTTSVIFLAFFPLPVQPFWSCPSSDRPSTILNEELQCSWICVPWVITWILVLALMPPSRGEVSTPLHLKYFPHLFNFYDGICFLGNPHHSLYPLSLSLLFHCLPLWAVSSVGIRVMSFYPVVPSTDTVPGTAQHSVPSYWMDVHQRRLMVSSDGEKPLEELSG